MAAVKSRIIQKAAAKEYLTLYPETSADIVYTTVEGITATNVEDALKELYNLIQSMTASVADAAEAANAAKEEADKISEKLADTDVKGVYSSVGINEMGLVVEGQNVLEMWDGGQTESDTLATGGIAFAKLDLFSLDSLETIVATLSAGEAKDRYFLGGGKSFTLKDGETMEVGIMDFDRDGENTMTLMATGLSVDTYAINGTATTDGGWAASKLATETLPKIFENFPEDLKAIVKTVKVKFATDDGVEADEEKLFIPGVADIYSTAAIEGCALTGFQEYKDIYTAEGEQFSYYKELIGDQSPSVACEALAKGVGYWLRTPLIKDGQYFWSMHRQGQLLSLTANSKLNIMICFVI